MESIWITYAWEDNDGGDVDFAAQELIRAGLDVKLDRWNLTAGKRLWEQIEEFIQDPSKTDAWLFYATQTSLGSQACKEEFAYALDRALNTRGEEFPVIALFPSPVDRSLIPAGIKTRLHVSLTDPDWKERIVAAVENREPDISRTKLDPFDLTIHELNNQSEDQRFAIELRPRAGVWAPFIVAIPQSEKERVMPNLVHGHSKRIPAASMIALGEGTITINDEEWWFAKADNEANPTQSYYLICANLPSEIAFGAAGDQQLYHVKL